MIYDEEDTDTEILEHDQGADSEYSVASGESDSEWN